MAARRTRTGSFEVERTTGSFEVLDRLFVYGTMRQGQTARSIVANSITRVMPATTNGQIYRFSMGYPGYVETPQGTVVGEVLWLTDLAATFGLLDAYEGEDFARTLKQVTITPSPANGHLAGETLWAWIYSLADPASAALGTLIPDGDWVRHWTEQNG